MNRVAKQELIKHMSEYAKSLARQFEKDMSLKAVRVGRVYWVRK